MEVFAIRHLRMCVTHELFQTAFLQSKLVSPGSLKDFEYDSDRDYESAS